MVFQVTVEKIWRSERIDLGTVIENLGSFFLTLVAKWLSYALNLCFIFCQGWIKLLVYYQLLMPLNMLEFFFSFFLPRPVSLFFCPGGAIWKLVAQEAVNITLFSGEKIDCLLDVNYGTVTGKGCVCIFKFFFILLFCCYKNFLKFIF